MKMITLRRLYKNCAKVFFYIFLFLIVPIFLKAQPNTLYFIDRVHQANYLNPATQGCCNGFLTLPGLSGLSVTAGNTGFTFNDLLHAGTGLQKDSLVLDIDKAKSKMGTNNYLLTNIDIPVFGFGFWARNSYITFEITNKTKMNLGYPKNLVELINGNNKFIGENNPVVIDHFGPNLINYFEFAVGWSKQITYRLTIGGRLKLLSGVACVQKHKSNFSLTTGNIDSAYALKLSTDLDYSIAGPFNYKYDNSGQVSDLSFDLTNRSTNTGLGLDFGAIYKMNDWLKLYASFTDLGFIKWSNNSMRIYKKGVFNYSGLTLDSIWTNKNYDEFKKWGDSISNFLHYNHTYKGFTTMLNTNIYLGANFEVTNSINFGFLSKTYLYDNLLHQAFTFSANFKPIKFLTASLSYSIMNRAYNNIGVGLVFGYGPFQFYMITDNIYLPKKSRLAEIMFGLNLNFGCRKRDNYSMLNNHYPDKKIDFL